MIKRKTNVENSFILKKEKKNDDLCVKIVGVCGTVALAIGLVAKLCPTLVSPWTVTHQAPLSMGFSRQEYWSGLSFPSLEDLPDPGIKPKSPPLVGSLLPCKQILYH